MLSKVASSTNFWVFGMTRPGIEPGSPGPLANTLLCNVYLGSILTISFYIPGLRIHHSDLKTTLSNRVFKLIKIPCWLTCINCAGLYLNLSIKEEIHWQYYLVSKLKLATRRLPFQLLLHWSVGESYSFLWIAPLYPWYVPYIAEY